MRTKSPIATAASGSRWIRFAQLEVSTKTLDWDVMGGTFFGSAPAFIVNLGGGDMAVTEQFLHLPNVDAGIEEQGSGGRPQ